MLYIKYGGKYFFSIAYNISLNNNLKSVLNTDLFLKVFLKQNLYKSFLTVSLGSLRRTVCLYQENNRTY